MRVLFIVVLILFGFAGLAASAACPTCADLSYDCVPDNYIYDSCPIASSSCPIPSCTAYCQGLLGADATGWCSNTQFACICQQGSGSDASSAPVGSPVPARSPATKAPGTKSATLVSATATAPVYLNFSSVSLTTLGVLSVGMGPLVMFILVGAAGLAIMVALFSYAFPAWKKERGSLFATPFSNIFG